MTAELRPLIDLPLMKKLGANAMLAGRAMSNTYYHEGFTFCPYKGVERENFLLGCIDVAFKHAGIPTGAIKS